MMPTTSGKPRPYTDEERAALLAPITIRQFGGKSWGGRIPYAKDFRVGHKVASEDERYGDAGDWIDLDRTR